MLLYLGTSRLYTFFEKSRGQFYGVRKTGVSAPALPLLGFPDVQYLYKKYFKLDFISTYVNSRLALSIKVKGTILSIRQEYVLGTRTWTRHLARTRTRTRFKILTSGIPGKDLFLPIIKFLRRKSR